MEATFRSQFLQLMAQQEADLARLFLTAAMQIEYSLNRYARASDGTISADKEELARQQVLAILSTLFVVLNTREGISAFTVNPISGIYIPESPFATRIWNTAKQAAELARAEQESILRRSLPADLTQAWERATVNPSLGGYTSPQNVVFDSGRALEDSVLFAAADTQRRVRQYLNTMFAEGKTAREISEALTAFLTPDNLSKRMNAPFGRNAITLAMQIARSTPVLAHSLVGRQLAQQNPFIQQIRIVRGRSVPCNICDPICDASPYPIDISASKFPGFHASCMCRVIYELTENTTAVIERLRGDDADLLSVRGALSPEIIDLLLRRGVGV